MSRHCDFVCKDLCVLHMLRCDGHKACSDGEDELFCSTGERSTTRRPATAYPGTMLQKYDTHIVILRLVQCVFGILQTSLKLAKLVAKSYKSSAFLKLVWHCAGGRGFGFCVFFFSFLYLLV